MKQLSKIATRQDANFKLSPSSSNETSINLSNEISDFISPASGEISFKIYKEDFIRALGALSNFTRIYNKKDTEPSRVNDLFIDLTRQIDAQFKDADTSIYTINLLKRDDGRSYFNGLKLANGFNLRSFLVEQYSEIIFEKSDNGKLSIRLNTSCEELKPTEELLERIKELPPFHEPLINESLQRIYYGAPGTGKSYTIDNLTDETNSVRTTFHPDSDYASFVGAYKPTMEPVPMSYVSDGMAKYAKDSASHPGTERKIVYKYVPQAFLKAYVAAWSNLEEPFYLVIEEINRGNCAQIFGDLFQLLDRNNHGSSSYAIAADEDIAQFLSDDKKGFAGLSEEQRKAITDFVLIKDNDKEVAIGPDILNGTKLLLPPNLRIWATMNTSDQSLFPIDSAFKRRWDWKYVPIEYNKKNWMLEVGGKRYRWGAFLEKMNPEIYTLTESADKQMGYFFAKPDKKSNPDLEDNDIISEEVFLNKVLFYLWSDVLKDYDLTKKPFVYEDEDKRNKAFRFTDFFPLPNNENLNKFVAGLELEVIGFVTNEILDDDSEESVNSSKSNRDNSTYSINGQGVLKKGPTAVEALKIYISSNPSATAVDVVNAWKVPDFPLVETEADFQNRKSKSNDGKLENRTEKIETGTHEYVRIFKGFTPQTMDSFINAINTKDWGIQIQKIE